MTGDSERGAPLSWGACKGAGPLSRSREASFRADPATVCGSNPIARSKVLLKGDASFLPFCSFMMIPKKEQR